KCKAQVMPVTDTNVQLDLFEETCRPLGAHIWRKEPTGCYAEPTWVSQRLFEVEKFSGTVWDPACGLARIPEAARAAGYAAFASDLVDRGYRYFDEALNFLACEHRLGDSIVTNPPFQICDLFARRALRLDVDTVAMIWLARRLNAAHWLRGTPLARIYL